MLFSLEGDVGRGNALGADGLEHPLRLVRRHDLVLQPLEQDQGTGQPVGVVDWRTLQIQVPAFRVRADQAVQIAGLELVGLFGQALQIADAVVAGAGLEDLLEGQGGQGGVPAGAASVDGQPVSVGFAPADQMQGGIAAVVDIHDSPGIVEPFPVLPAVAGAAAVVDVQDTDAPAGPELDPQVQGGGGRSGGAAVTLDQQGRFLSGRPLEVAVLGRVEEGVGRLAVDRRKLHCLGG